MANEKLIDRFLIDRARGYEYRQEFEPGWLKRWQGYMNLRPRPKIPNEFWSHSRTRVPDEFRIIETLLPQHLLGMFRSPNWFSVQSIEGPGQFYDTLVKALLLGGWNKAGMFGEYVTGMKYAMITGHAWTKTYWDVRVGPKEVMLIDDAAVAYDGEQFGDQLVRKTENQVTFAGPRLEFPDNYEIIIDPTGENEWAMQHMSRSLEKLEYQNSLYDGALYDTAALKRLKTKRANRASRNMGRAYPGSFHSGTHATGAIPTEGLVEYVEGKRRHHNTDAISIWQWWTWIPPSLHSYDDTQWRMILVADDEEVIRDVAAPTPDRRHPYDPVRPIPIPGRIYGESPLYWVGDLIDLRNFIEDARREEAIQKLWQPMIVDEQSTLSPESLFRKPGGMLWVGNHTGNLRDTILPIPQSDVMPSAYQESAVKQDQIDRATGATDIMSGTPLGGRATATEANILAQFGSGRFQLATMHLDETSKKPVLERMFKLYQTRLEQKEILELTGKAEGRYNVDMRDLIWDITVRVDSGAFGSLDQQLFQAYLQLYGTFANNPVANQYLNHESIIRNSFVRAGDPMADQNVRTQQDVMAEQQAAQQQQLEAEQRGLAGQQSVDVNRELARGVASAIGRGGEGRSPESSLV